MGGKKKRSGSNVKLETGVERESDERGASEAEDVKASKWRYFSGKAGGKKEKERGVVYISCLPHGFYEKQLEGYFGQFGKVTGVYVPKSKKTGKSKGYAFVQFLHPEVAQIAAETMNNYLMFNRLIKTEVVPPERQRPVMFRQKFKDMKCRQHEDKVRQARRKQRKLVGALSAQDLAGRLRKVQDSLRSLGVEYKMKVAGLREEVRLTKLTPIDPDTQLNVEKENESSSGKKSKKKSKKGGDSVCQSVALPSAGLLTLAQRDLADKAQRIIGSKRKQMKQTKDKIVEVVRQLGADSQTDGETDSNTAGSSKTTKPAKLSKGKAASKKGEEKTVSQTVGEKITKVKNKGQTAKEKTAAKMTKTKVVNEKTAAKTSKAKVVNEKTAVKSSKTKTAVKKGSKLKTVAPPSPIGKRKSKAKLETTV